MMKHIPQDLLSQLKERRRGNMFLFKKHKKSKFYLEIESLINQANPDKVKNNLKIIHKKFVNIKK